MSYLRGSALFALIGLVLIGALGVFAYSYVNRPAWRTSEWNTEEAGPPIPHTVLFVKQEVPDTLAGRVITLQPQIHAGLEVEGSFLKVVSEAGAPVWTRARFVPVEKLPDPRDLVIQSEVLDLVKTESAKMAETLHCKLEQTEPQAVLRHRRAKWRVVYLRPCKLKSGQIDLLAFNDSGEMVQRQRASSGFAWQNLPINVYPEGPKHSRLTQLGVPVSKEPGYLQTPIVEAVSEGGFEFASPEQLSTLQPTDERFDLAQAYFYATKALLWAQKQLDTDGRKIKLRTDVGYPEATNAMFYWKNNVFFGSGDGKTFEHIARDPTIVTHEVMHTLVDGFTGLPVEGEGGALNEGLADTLTAMILGSPRMGDTAFMHDDYQRTLNQRVSFHQREGSKYQESLALSGMIWQMREDMGEDVAKDLLVRLLTRTTPDSNFESTRNIVRDWANGCLEGERCHRVASILSQRGWL